MPDQDPCLRPLAFPRRPDNRPALPRIAYRIGTYSDLREYLLRRLDDVTATPELAHWTHREPDDPGIALLEGAAAVVDVLTFYQELYANEAFLRTARERRSVAELVRLLGYRLAPGLGGRGTFAVEVRPGDPITVPAGFPLQAQLAGAGEPAAFETVAPLVAYPELSRFHLYRPLTQPTLATGATELWLRSSEPFEVAEDDRLLVAAAAGSDPRRLTSPQVVVVDEVTSFHGATLVKIRGALGRPSPAYDLVAYQLGRTFRHFGHTAPPQAVTLAGSSASARDVDYCRGLSGTVSSYRSYWAASSSEPLGGRDLPLDQAVDDFAAGGSVICTYRSGCTSPQVYYQLATPLLFQGAPTFESPAAGARKLGVGGLTAGIDPGFSTAPAGGRVLGVEIGALTSYTVLRTVTAVRAATLSWGSLNGPTTFLTLDADLAVAGATRTDVRSVEVHEVVGPALSVRAKPVDAATSSGQVLYLHAPAAVAAALDGRRVMLAPPAGEATVAAATVRVATSPLPGFADLHEVTLDVSVDYADYPQEPDEETAIAVHGNLVEADQGKSEREAVLGSGDGRRTFQTFKLPKAPLTYHYAPAQAPPQVPRLEVRVAGRLWTRVDSLYDRGLADEVYVVREDAEGGSWVQFGDGGRFGARLPSGVDNVVARFRTGIGAHGALEAGTRVQAGSRLDRLDRIGLPGVVSGGDDPEAEDVARDAAPGRVQSLGRIVGLSDFESEALAVPGVALAAAAWEVRDGVPAVVVTVLMESGRSGEYEAVAAALRAAARERGPDRFEVEVREGAFRDVQLHLQVALVPGWQEATVRAAVAAALGVEAEGAEPPGQGLFSLRRRFGQAEHASRVAGAVQNVAGVSWVRIERFQAASFLGRSAFRGRRRRRPAATSVACPPDRVLRLVDRTTDSPYRLTLTAGAEEGRSP
jgi:predicted phage baseplate assembly protein